MNLGRLAILAALLSAPAQSDERRVLVARLDSAPVAAEIQMFAWPGGLGIPKVITWADTTGASGIAWGSTSAITAANASITYDGTEMEINVPTGKSLSFDVNNVAQFTVSNTSVAAFDTWQGITAANTINMGATGGNLQLGKSGTGDFTLGPNSANSVLGFYAGSAGAVRTQYATVDLNGIHGGGVFGVTGYTAPFVTISAPNGYILNTSSGVTIAGYKVATGRGIVATRMTVTESVGVTGTAGAATEIATLTDGTNTCTFTILCTSFISGTTVAVAGVNGAGTGCTFTTAADIRANFTSTCTTQPSATSVVFEGTWN